MSLTYRSPFSALQEAIYDRLGVVLSGVPVYSLVPDHEPLAYVFLGEFRDQPTPDDCGTINHDCTYALQFWCHQTTATNPVSTIHTYTDTAMAGLTRHFLELSDSWTVVDTAVDSIEIYEVAVDEFGHLIHATVVFRFRIQDGR